MPSPRLLSHPAAGTASAATRGAEHHEEGDMPMWPLSPAAGVLRQIVQAPAFAVLSLLAPARVTGLEALAAIDGPVLFAANHSSHFDTPVLLRALPGKRRNRLVVAAAADYFFSKPLVGAAVALGFNAFPFERASCSRVRATLTQCSELVEDGWSILLYPEGTRSTSGEIGAFKPGLGLLAANLGVPVVPAHIGGLFAVMPKGQHIPHPGHASVHFGEPLYFASDAHYRDVAQSVEDAVRGMAESDLAGEEAVRTARHSTERRQHAYSHSQR